jgi:hypothetical protein
MQQFTKQITRMLKHFAFGSFAEQSLKRHKIDVRDVRIQSHYNDVGVEESAVAKG